jgi:hypothetical protein
MLRSSQGSFASGGRESSTPLKQAWTVRAGSPWVARVLARLCFSVGSLDVFGQVVIGARLLGIFPAPQASYQRTFDRLVFATRLGLTCLAGVP